MTDPRTKERAAKVAERILQERPLAFEVSCLLNGAHLAGPWERHTELNLLGRRFPQSSNERVGFAATVTHSGSWYEWTTGAMQQNRAGAFGMAAQRPGGTGKATSLIEAVMAADRRLREDGWKLVGRAKVGTAWSAPTRDAISNGIVPGTVRRMEGSREGPVLVEVYYGDIPVEGVGDVEGCEVRCDAVPTTDVGVVEKRPTEDPLETIKRAAKLIDDRLRDFGWMLEPGGLGQ